MFDAILLDAPCSGEGVVRRSDALLKLAVAGNLDIAAATQQRLLDSAFMLYDPAAQLVYLHLHVKSPENEAVCLWRDFRRRR